jgi:hypothetical protein
MSTPPPAWPPPPGGFTPTPGPGAGSGNGTLILVLGILSILFCGVVLGPIAWVMGNNALAAINAGQGNPSELGTITAGRICGIIGTILSALILIVYVAAFAIGIGAGLTHPGRTAAP